MEVQISGSPSTLRDLFDTSPEAKTRRELESEEMKRIFDDARVGHDCNGRGAAWKHGTIPAAKVKQYGEGKLIQVLTYYMGSKPAWKDKQGNLEFVYQCSGGPAERCDKPWQWCGTAALPEFVEWQAEDTQRATANRAVRYKLKIGSIVSFKDRQGTVVEGEVVRILTLIHVKVGSSIWRCTPSILTVLDKPSKPIGLTPEQEQALRKAGLL